MKRMPRFAPLAVLLLGSAAYSGVTVAGIYTDDLSRCLVSKSTEGDKILLAKWIFSMVALHPGVESMSRISEEDRAAINKGVAGIFEKLLTDACVVETRAAIKFEGEESLKNSFKVLGEIAMTSLLADKKVQAGSGDFAKYLDEQKLKSAFEAGK